MGQHQGLHMNLCLVFLILFSGTYGSAATGDPRDKAVIMFVCEHGSAKSVVAAAHFNRLAEQEGLAYVAVSRGTIPDPEIAQPAVKGLRGDGILLQLEKPAKLTSSEASKALRVVSFCDLPKDFKADNVERWTVPPISEDYSKARDAIIKNLHHLIYELKKSR